MARLSYNAGRIPTPQTRFITRGAVYLKLEANWFHPKRRYLSAEPLFISLKTLISIFTAVTIPDYQDCVESPMTGVQIFSKKTYIYIYKSLQNSWRQKGYTKQVSYSGLTNIRVKNLLAWATWRPEYVHPDLLSFY
jgi:hypothetical protein